MASAEHWRPGASRERLVLRARLRERVRAHFAATDALEVDTPVACASLPAERHIRPGRVTLQGRLGFLRTSPETHMKRLLAAGCGDCWQLGPVFRDGETGRLHQPEFTLLEWYRVGIDHHRLMDEVETLLAVVLGPGHAPPIARRVAWAEAFDAVLGLDPLAATVGDLRAAAAGFDVDTAVAFDERADWLDWLLATVVAPRLSADAPLFIHAWPAAHAALARMDPGTPPTARRFECYWQGVELANGFHELADPGEQRRRFEAERAAIRADGGDPPALDEALLAALAAGLPGCAGVAVGFDRLVMLAAGAGHIDEVMAFGGDRA